MKAELHYLEQASDAISDTLRIFHLAASYQFRGPIGRSNSSSMSKLSSRSLGQDHSRVWRRALDSILIFF